MVLDALRDLEAEHGSGRWFFVHAVVRAAWPEEGDAATESRGALRLSRDTEAALNPSRILAGLGRRGLIERNPKRGLGASVRLTVAGRTRGAPIANASSQAHGSGTPGIYVSGTDPGERPNRAR
jgi:hypothetical protein